MRRFGIETDTDTDAFDFLRDRRERMSTDVERPRIERCVAVSVEREQAELSLVYGRYTA